MKYRIYDEFDSGLKDIPAERLVIETTRDPADLKTRLRRLETIVSVLVDKSGIRLENFPGFDQIIVEE